MPTSKRVQRWKKSPEHAMFLYNEEDDKLLSVSPCALPLLNIGWFDHLLRSFGFWSLSRVGINEWLFIYSHIRPHLLWEWGQEGHKGQFMALQIQKQVDEPVKSAWPPVVALTLHPLFHLFWNINLWALLQLVLHAWAVRVRVGYDLDSDSNNFI